VSIPVLQAASRAPRQNCAPVSKELTVAGVLGDEVDEVVSFRHVLLRDAAYDSLC